MSVLVGALLAANMRFWAVPLGQPHRATPGAEFDRIVRVLTEVFGALPRRVPSARFRADFDGDARAADRVATLLAAQGYIVRVWPVTARGGPAGVWDEYWLASPELPGRTLRPIFDRVWRGDDAASHGRHRTPPAGRAAPLSVDPGGVLLGRSIAEVLAAAARD
jgi:hypothetical protein